MQEDELKTRELEDSIQRLEGEIEFLESGLSSTSTKESLAEEMAHSEPENQDTVKIQKVSLYLQNSLCSLLWLAMCADWDVRYG
ncbi:hypothetical protein AB205_0002100 [Aquarana catesbeiana]|uniref:Uncharacterized protein n=1 Tax=Aquarana catesbeiana TaxID=8400 RepID=A0A2G9RWA0_AQUCT|nr:hypothetical protein AB205_0002100 [Aquarana catesbeiana]PIO31493.1 hypothetical protein AB205_0002100 [Aquarana catesbeiana]